MFRGQTLHYVLLTVLLAGVVAASGADVMAGQFLGLSTAAWLVGAIAVPILHQFYVWLVWRSELHHAWISRAFGREAGFRYYAVGFAILFALRLLTIIALALANRNSLDVDPTAARVLALGLSIPTLYLFYSVVRYFGVARAFGIDHFDARYRSVPFVREGIFRFGNNGMYVFGFLVLWLPGLLWLSKAALLAALFNHLYIWVHYYCTELPDIRKIYGSATKPK
ncbi:MAG: hypothetical protein HY899_02650 [Deltaproteobacteria bacterium]|nr:hypothetical protein [Deltaproteobacteria bacterium]